MIPCITFLRNNRWSIDGIASVLRSMHIDVLWGGGGATFFEIPCPDRQTVREEVETKIS